MHSVTCLLPSAQSHVTACTAHHHLLTRLSISIICSGPVYAGCSPAESRLQASSDRAQHCPAHPRSPHIDNVHVIVAGRARMIAQTSQRALYQWRQLSHFRSRGLMRRRRTCNVCCCDDIKHNRGECPLFFSYGIVHGFIVSLAAPSRCFS